MKYEIGQKVETPFGVAVIKYYLGGNTTWLSFDENMAEIEFDIKYLKPYKTPHEKLLDMGYELDDRIDVKIYRHDTLSDVRVYDDNTISCNEITLELSHIIAEYLEWLEEEK